MYTIRVFDHGDEIGGQVVGWVRERPYAKGKKGPAFEGRPTPLPSHNESHFQVARRCEYDLSPSPADVRKLMPCQIYSHGRRARSGKFSIEGEDEKKCKGER